jgi:hypothetical protein
MIENIHVQVYMHIMPSFTTLLYLLRFFYLSLNPGIPFFQDSTSGHFLLFTFFLQLKSENKKIKVKVIDRRSQPTGELLILKLFSPTLPPDQPSDQQRMPYPFGYRPARGVGDI